MNVERSDFIEAGGSNVTITDALAQSLPLLGGEQARHPEDAKITAATPRIYWLYLADFHISRATATSRTGDVVTADGLLGRVQLRPQAGSTLHTGQVLQPVSGEEDSPSGVGSIAVEYQDGDPSPAQVDATTGQVKIIHLDETTLCADINLHQTYRGKPTVAIVGTVRFPIVEAGRVMACPPPPSGGCTAIPRPT